ncbi:glutaminase [Clostridium tepidiprofundi DSM 19306]|uniref:Glutaminase n=1 Tax=Clostridium tepidiprofundi DSM 19306 TaxID=1121338 RepID=A0A151B280_9CLOT|nr:glutaminase A [Clostridium tepidiprofundi]KYH34014.1 glutaminase [Clostridium tepidiprofundi DSM 19306]
MKRILENIIENNRKWTKEGELASYIPELTRADKDALGICVTTLDGDEFYAGDYKTKFTIQSVSKVITLMLAILDNGKDYVFSKVGMEPTESAFNSIINLETNTLRKPLNPMINAGAITIVSLLSGENSDDKFNRILKFTRKITGNDSLNINEQVYSSEKATGNRNRALAHFMKSLDIIEGDVEEILDVYFKQCSIEVTCTDIARIGAMLANDGVLPWNNERVISREATRLVKTIMVTCGMYDASGKFAVHIGIPAKSGVGGGIMAAVPRRMGIGVVGPALDEKGNSIGGIKVLEELSRELDLSIF